MGKTSEKGKSAKNPKTKKTGSLWLALGCIVLGMVAGVLIGVIFSKERPAAQKVFAVEDLWITLTEDFQAFENERFTGVLINNDVSITFLKEPFQAVPGSEALSLEEYGHLVIGENGITGTMLCTVDGLTYFEFQRENQETGTATACFAAVYKTADAFWLLQFTTVPADYSRLQPYLEAWARTVDFE